MKCTVRKTTGSIDAAVVAMLKTATGDPEFKNPFEKTQNAIRDGVTFADGTACTDTGTATVGLTNIDHTDTTVTVTTCFEAGVAPEKNIITVE